MIYIHKSLPGSPSPVSKPHSANICLFNGIDRNNRIHLPGGEEGNPRLRAVDWDQGGEYPRVPCWLNSVGANIQIQIMPPPCDFIFMPDFEHSIISSQIAKYFGLSWWFENRQEPIPFMQCLGRNAGISITASARADVVFRGQKQISPIPSCYDVKFWISESVPYNFAVLGREVVNYLVIVFQGIRSAELMQHNRPGGPGALYFGANARCFDHGVA